MSSASRPEGPAVPPFAALVVEDEGLIAVGLEDLLANLGAERVVWAPRAAEALEAVAAAEPPFAVAIVDWLLGERTAQAVVAALVAAGTPVLVFTGAPETVVLPAGGRVAMIGKPAREAIVAAAVRRLMAGGVSAGTESAG